MSENQNYLNETQIPKIVNNENMTLAQLIDSTPHRTSQNVANSKDNTDSSQTADTAKNTAENTTENTTEDFVEEKNGIVRKNGIVVSYNGQTKFLKTYTYYDGPTEITLQNGRAILIEADNTVFEFQGQTKFKGITRESDGSTKIVLDEENISEIALSQDQNAPIANNNHTNESVWENKTILKKEREVLVENNGQVFTYNGQSDFEKIWRIFENVTIVKLDNGLYSLVEKDWSVLKYGEQTEFKSIIRNRNGSTEIKLVNDLHVLIEKDGTVFTYNNQTEFLSIIRKDNGMTEITEGNQEKITIFPDGKVFDFNKKPEKINIENYKNPEN